MIEVYDICTEYALSDLIEKVKELISKGWQPLGGVFVAHEEGSVRFYGQTIVKYEAEVL